MPVTAPVRISLRQNARGRNPRRPEKSQTRARCAMRSAVFANPRYSPGAKAIFGLMDDWGGWGGLAYPKHATLARQMGRSRQSVQRWIAELERGGEIVRIEAAGRATVYAMKWAAEAHRRASALVNNPVCSEPDCGPRSIPEPSALAADDATPEQSDCLHCGGTGDRVYVQEATTGIDGRRIAASTWRGWCGCQPKGAIMRGCEKTRQF
jgi:hypothetical protein